MLLYPEHACCSAGVANGAVFPTLPNPVYPGGTCNDYLPAAPMDRFLWVINFFATNGFYVVRPLSCQCVCHSTVSHFIMSHPISQLHVSKQATNRSIDHPSQPASQPVSQVQLEVCSSGPRSRCNFAVWLAFLLPFLAFPALQSLPLLQVPDWHPGVPASNQEIFSQDSWQVNMENFFSKLVTTYPGVVGKLILDLVNVSHSSSPPHPS